MSFLRIALSFLLLLLFSCSGFASDAGIETGLPFELKDHRLFIPVQIEDSRPLLLFLDTGLTYPGIFLFHEEIINELVLPEYMDVLVPGAGDEEPSPAVMADSVTLRLGDILLHNQWVVISRGERTQDFPSDGIIGGTLFTGFAVEVDHNAQRMHLHNADDFHADSTWTILPVELRKGIPWIDAHLDIDGSSEEAIRVYIDLADDIPLHLLTGPNRRFQMPNQGKMVYLGTGLSGDIHGKHGRVASLRLGPHQLSGVTMAYAPGDTRSKQDGADGIVGNGLLERFHLVFDYQRRRILIKPNTRFGDPFE